MSMKMRIFLNIAMVLLSWSTLPFFGLQNMKRFFPVSLLIGVIEAVNVLIGKKRKWWVFYHKPNSYLFNEFPFNIGPFLIGSMWILKWTYGKFSRFVLLNAIVNAFFAFPFSVLSKKIRYYTLVRFNHFQFFLYFFLKAFVFYWLQYLYEKKTTKLRVIAITKKTC
ncbi:hypothetical protein H5P36_17425 [Bacillus sp. APMAM]|nr:hypothetical protein [Bacillus sp. APMAM]RTZ54718.1 hypothetical protein EKO25_16660 [Bacillus sp. SAJ1]